MNPYSNLFTLDEDGALQRRLLFSVMGTAAAFVRSGLSEWSAVWRTLDHFAAWGEAARDENLETEAERVFLRWLRQVSGELGISEVSARNICALASDCLEEIAYGLGEVRRES